jgi:S-DNA-T family DNA segregation ATPase FtsK/SpoIIIE
MLCLPLYYIKASSGSKICFSRSQKVELTLFNKIERHYLAKLPDVEDAIITDNAKVVNTKLTLC